MSFILDALRKSDNQRHREITPALPETRIVQRESKMPYVLGAIALLLVVNLAVLGALYLRRDPAPAALGAAAPAVPAAAPLTARGNQARSAPAATVVRPLVDEAQPVYAEPIEPPPLRGTGRADPTLVAPEVASTPRVRRLEDGNPDLAAAMAAQQQAAVEAAPGGSQSSRGVPSINDLGPQATAGLPQLNVDLHVYATDPASRFVMINGRRYLEGGRLPEGALVEHITPEGVIMNNKGTRFLLPRE